MIKNSFWLKYGRFFTFFIALIATLGSLYYSEIAGFIPCQLCWYQRILMYPLVLVMLVAIVEEDDWWMNYILPFAVLGIGLSGYHYALQLGFMGNPGTCSIGVPCNARYVSYFGFITIPFMALTAFILIIVTTAVTRQATLRSENEVELA